MKKRFLTILMWVTILYSITVNAEVFDGQAGIYYSENDVWIENEDGKTIADMADGDFSSILAYTPGYYMLYKDTSGFEEGEKYLGILSSEGEWIFEYENPNLQKSDNFPGTLDLCNDTDYYGLKYLQNADYDRFVYCGNGVFGYSCATNFPYGSGDDYCQFFNVKYRTKYRIDITWPEDLRFDDDEEYTAFTTTDDSYFVSAKDGVLGEVPIGSRDDAGIGEYSDGGFIIRTYSYEKSAVQLKFFDCKTKEITLLLEDANRIKERYGAPSYKFVDGYAVIDFEGADGNIYYAVIDKAGNMIIGPQRNEPDLSSLPKAEAINQTSNNGMRMPSDSNVETTEEVKNQYKIFLSPITWEEALKACENDGGHLVTIESPGELEYLIQLLENYNAKGYRLYIGGYRDRSKIDYYWISSEAHEPIEDMSWTNDIWLTGEPSYWDESINAEEDVLEMFYYEDEKRWVWNDVPNNLPQYLPRGESVGYICEYGE